MISGKMTTQLLAVAARLDLADLLDGGPRSVDDLAAATDTHAPSLYRVLRALASLGVFAETQPRHFRLTPLARPLRRDAPDSVRDFAVLFGSDWHTRAWSDLLHSVRTGETAFEHAFGEGMFEHLQAHPERFAAFNDAMTALSRLDVDAILQAYDFSDFDTVVDVGGGHGFLLAEILKAHPSAQGVLLDIPEVAAGARATMREAGVADRCQVVEGDFFERIPEGGDVYLLKLIIHDWDDDRARAILRTCRDAMPGDGTLLVANSVIPPGNDPYIGKLVDVEMLVMTPGGRERTEAEFRELFEEAGFALTRTIPTPSYLYLLEATPA
jgi:predicted O-methyltransferase YrrM